MKKCSFCGSDDEARTFVEGNGAYICILCIELMHEVVVNQGVRTKDQLDAKTGSMTSEDGISNDYLHDDSCEKASNSAKVGFSEDVVKALTFCAGTDTGEIDMKTFKLEMKQIFKNSDSGEEAEFNFSLSVSNEKINDLIDQCRNEQSSDNFAQLFKRLFDNPNMDGTDAGVCYDECWKAFSKYAFEKLGWSDVTVDTVGLVVNGTDLGLDPNLIDCSPFSLQLSKESGFMYCYA
jgi:ClpX C4-type zinc finger